MSYLNYKDVEKLRRALLFITKNVEGIRANGIDFVTSLAVPAETSSEDEATRILEEKARKIGQIIADGAFGCQQENVRKMMSLLMGIEVPERPSSSNKLDPFMGYYNFPGLCWIIANNSVRNNRPTFYLTDDTSQQGSYGAAGIVQRNFNTSRMASADIIRTEPREGEFHRLATLEEINQNVDNFKEYGAWDSANDTSVRGSIHRLAVEFYPKYAETIDTDLGLEALSDE